MKVNIVCSDPTWIYGQFIEQFKKYSKHEILLNAKNGYDTIYFLPYYEWYKTDCISTAWFSHQELKEPLKSKFISAAKEVDWCISQSKKYADTLWNNGIEKVTQIMPGIDFNIYKPRAQQLNNRSKLVVGYVGRNYTSTNRKNTQLIEKIAKFPFIDLKITGGKIATDKMPQFYTDLDIVVNTATVEGGPMAIQEALAVGVPIICYENVGVADEFGIGCFRIPFGNEEIFLARLEDFWKSGMYKRWSKPELVEKMTSQVKQFTWQKFVNDHDKIWEQVFYAGNRQD